MNVQLFLTAVKIGKNTAVSGETKPGRLPNGELVGGGVIIKAGDNV